MISFDAMRSALLRGYPVSRGRMVPMRNGLYRSFYLYRRELNSVRSQLRQLGLPAGKRFVFAWGRCTEQKGYDLLIPAFGHFVRDHPTYHLVVIMPVETAEPSYVEKIKRELRRLPAGSVTPLFAFEKHLPSAILRLPELAIVVFPSRFEGSPLAPREALAFARSTVRFVYSSIPPHMELFEGERVCGK